MSSEGENSLITDKPPRKKVDKQEYSRSDDMRSMPLPVIGSLRENAALLERALADENRAALQKLSNSLALEIASAYGAEPANIKVLGVRPLEKSDDYVDEIYGDYDPETLRIRLWMRTAVKKKATSYGTFLATLCHEVCHHLDIVKFELPNTFHTRGFFERTGLLYHHIRDTPPRNLVWKEDTGGIYRINWPETMRGEKQ